jgi:probable rRNA maturation factor
MTLPVRTTVIRNAHPRLRLDRHAVARAIRILDENFAKSPLERGGAVRRGVSAVPPGELSVAFLTDPALAKIHAAFMNDPSVTDVITFEGDPLAGLAGEICVSADTARAYARKLQRDFSAELTLYLVHGWLHLAGYDDLQPARKRRMRAAEKRAMTLLRRQKALPVFQFK